MSLRRLTPLVTLFALALVACSSDDSSPNTNGNDASANGDAGPKNDGSADGSASALNGCTTFADKTGGTDADRTISWNFDAVPPSTCLKIAKGQQVTWKTTESGQDLAYHPLGTQGGDANSPINYTDSGTMVSFTFANAGLFGFRCYQHGTMTGAIQVVSP